MKQSDSSRGTRDLS